jgi:hypothetical protein
LLAGSDERIEVDLPTVEASEVRREGIDAASREPARRNGRRVGAHLDVRERIHPEADFEAPLDPKEDRRSEGIDGSRERGRAGGRAHHEVENDHRAAAVPDEAKLCWGDFECGRGCSKTDSE